MTPKSATPARLPIPFVSYVIIAGSVIVHLVQLGMIEKGIPEAVAQLRLGGLFGPLVRERQWWRLITFAFVHGGYLHLAANMFAVYSLGIPLERRLGTRRFLPLSLAACLGSAAAIVLLSRAPTLTVGASGVIFGWLGALLFLVARAQLKELGKMLLLNAAISLIPGVSWQGHLGGFLAGILCGFLLRADPAKFSARVPVVVALGGVLSLWGAYAHP